MPDLGDNAPVAPPPSEPDPNAGIGQRGGGMAPHAGPNWRWGQGSQRGGSGQGSPFDLNYLRQVKKMWQDIYDLQVKVFAKMGVPGGSGTNASPNGGYQSTPAAPQGSFGPSGLRTASNAIAVATGMAQRWTGPALGTIQQPGPAMMSQWQSMQMGASGNFQPNINRLFSKGTVFGGINAMDTIMSQRMLYQGTTFSQQAQMGASAMSLINPDMSRGQAAGIQAFQESGYAQQAARAMGATSFLGPGGIRRDQGQVYASWANQMARGSYGIQGGAIKLNNGQFTFSEQQVQEARRQGTSLHRNLAALMGGDENAVNTLLDMYEKQAQFAGGKIKGSRPGELFNIDSTKDLKTVYGKTLRGKEIFNEASKEQNAAKAYGGMTEAAGVFADAARMFHDAVNRLVPQGVWNTAGATGMGLSALGGPAASALGLMGIGAGGGGGGGGLGGLMHLGTSAMSGLGIANMLGYGGGMAGLGTAAAVAGSAFLAYKAVDTTINTRNSVRAHGERYAENLKGLSNRQVFNLTHAHDGFLARSGQYLGGQKSRAGFARAELERRFGSGWRGMEGLSDAELMNKMQGGGAATPGSGTTGAGTASVANSSLSAMAGGSAAVALARKEIGKPYKWGASGPDSFDCSGLVQYVYRQLGVSLPRTSPEQAKAGSAVGSISEAQPGDLVAFNSGGASPVHHIGIYSGNGMMVHAPHTGTNVTEGPVGGRALAAIRRVQGASVGSGGAASSPSGASTGAGGFEPSGGGLASSNFGGNSESSIISSMYGRADAMGGIASSTSDAAAGMAMDSGTGTSPSTASGGGAGVSTATNAAYAAGFRGAALREIVAIAGRESSWVPTAHNTNRATGDNSYGLTQINMLDNLGPARRKQFGIANNDALLDPYANMRAAFILSGGGRNFSPWTYGSHATDWQKYLGQANEAAAKAGYASGAWEVPKDEITKVHKGEMVVPAGEAAIIRGNNGKPTASGGGSAMTIYVQPGAIVVQALPGQEEAAGRGVLAFLNKTARDAEVMTT